MKYSVTKPATTVEQCQVKSRKGLVSFNFRPKNDGFHVFVFLSKDFFEVKNIVIHSHPNLS